MKKLLLLALLLLPVQAWATVTVGDISSDACAGSPTVCTSTAKNHAAGNAVIVIVGTIDDGADQTVSTCTSTADGSLTSDASAKRTNGNSFRLEMWWVMNSAGNASDVVVCTYTGSVSNADIRTIEVDFDGTLAFDTASHSSGEASATSYPVATFSSAGAGILIYTSRLSAVCPSPPATPAFTDVGDSCGTSYRITSGTETSITPTGTSATSQNWQAMVGSFVETGPAGTGYTTQRGIITP